MKNDDVVIKLRYRKVLRLPKEMYKAMLKQEEFGSVATCLLCEDAVKGNYLFSSGKCVHCRFPKFRNRDTSFRCLDWMYSIGGPRLQEHPREIYRLLRTRRVLSKVSGKRKGKI